MKFKLGSVVATRNALAALEEEGVNPLILLGRHMQGDWGTVDAEDWKANEDALKNDTRLFSVYVYGSTRFYVITEWDRSVTTILLPSDY